MLAFQARCDALVPGVAGEAGRRGRRRDRSPAVNGAPWHPESGRRRRCRRRAGDAVGDDGAACSPRSPSGRARPVPLVDLLVMPVPGSARRCGRRSRSATSSSDAVEEAGGHAGAESMRGADARRAGCCRGRGVKSPPTASVRSSTPSRYSRQVSVPFVDGGGVMPDVAGRSAVVPVTGWFAPSAVSSKSATSRRWPTSMPRK